MLNSVLIKKTMTHAVIPTRATPGSTGYDLYASEYALLGPGEVRAISTGLMLDLSRLPPGVDLQIRPRSGLALKQQLTVLNSPGTIDRDYQGELRVILINLGTSNHVVNPGDRIAQLVFGMALPAVTFFPVEEISEETSRGGGGFGSTGK